MNADRIVSFEAQYDALRDARGFVQLADWSSVTLTGADRQKFLNNFCTNDVVRLLAGESCEAFFCNVKGRIIGHGLVTCRDDELVIVGPPGQGAALSAHLDRYVIREDVQVRDTTAERAYLLVAGGGSSEKLGGSASFRWQIINVDNVRLLETKGVELSRELEDLANRGFVACGREVFDTLRIEAGTPLFGVDFDDHNFPQEVGRDSQAISFTKGCYLGQETVARIDALGHVNQRIAGIAFSGSDLPSSGTELNHAGLHVGRITSATYSPALGRPLALAMVRREQNAVGSRLESPIGACEVVALPVTARPGAS